MDRASRPPPGRRVERRRLAPGRLGRPTTWNFRIDNDGAYLLSAALAALGCVDTSGTSATLASHVRDSAGVVVVENEGPDPTSRMAWLIEPQPWLSIGALEGEARYQLFGVEDALRLGDGRILIANGGTSEIRVFDDAGTFVEAWGREGEGPGEFTGLTDVARWVGDSIAAWDFHQHRLTIFDSAGRRGRTLILPLGDELGPGSFEGVLPDRSILTASQISFGGAGQPTGLVRRTREYVRMDASGARLNGFGRHPDEEYYIRGDLMAIMRHPFRRAAHAAIWGERVIISPSDRYEIRGYDAGGDLDIIVRRDHELVAVTQADVDRHRDAQLATAEPSALPTLIELYEGFPTVETFPAFSRLLVDAAGNLWVRDYVLPGVELAVWTVFDPDGRIRGLVETPPGLVVYEIGFDYLLGRATDDLEVEYVQLWRLNRNENRGG